MAEFEGEVAVVRGNVFEFFMFDQVKKEAEFIEGRAFPGSGLFDAEHLYGAENDGDARVKGGYKFSKQNKVNGEK